MRMHRCMYARRYARVWNYWWKERTVRQGKLMFWRAWKSVSIIMRTYVCPYKCMCAHIYLCLYVCIY